MKLKHIVRVLQYKFEQFNLINGALRVKRDLNRIKNKTLWISFVKFH